jgi:hypothetical protein
LTDCISGMAVKSARSDEWILRSNGSVFLYAFISNWSVIANAKHTYVCNQFRLPVTFDRQMGCGQDAYKPSFRRIVVRT